jgi:hypothetical protein
MQIRRVVASCLVLGLFAVAADSLSAQRNNDNKQPQPPKRTEAEQKDIDALIKLVDAVAAGTQPAPTDIPIAWEANHFVKGQADTYIPYSLTIDRSKMNGAAASYYVRVVDKAAAAATAKGDNKTPPRYPWDGITFFDIPANGKISRAMALKAGEYEAFIVVKDKGTTQRNAPAAKVGLLRKTITVPDFTAADKLSTSSVLLAANVEPVTAQLSPAEQEANPYVFGPMKITPSPDGKYAKSGELQVIFWIYGAKEATGGKPDVTVEFNFHQRLAEGEKYFNKTQPQALNAQTLPPEFSLAAGHQLPGSLIIPLASFPVGDYRLEIKVTDKASGQNLTENVSFSVS